MSGCKSFIQIQTLLFVDEERKWTQNSPTPPTNPKSMCNSAYLR